MNKAKEEKKPKTFIEKLADSMLKDIVKHKKEYMCGVCGKPIADYDVRNFRFEYCESKIGGKQYFHKSCVGRQLNVN